MIGRIARYGGDVAGLLQGESGAGQDAGGPAPRVIAGWRVQPRRASARAAGQRDFRSLAGLMQTPLATLGDRAPAKPVWHCQLRAAPQDRPLSDAQWAQIARDVMNRTGLSPAGQQDNAVPWVAIRRGGDRLDIVAVLARQDGGKAHLPLRSVYRQIGDACRAAEGRYGLRPAAAIRRRGAPPVLAADRPRTGAAAHPPRPGSADFFHPRVPAAAAAPMAASSGQPRGAAARHDKPRTRQPGHWLAGRQPPTTSARHHASLHPAHGAGRAERRRETPRYQGSQPAPRRTS